jgi:hypothetical protein
MKPMPTQPGFRYRRSAVTEARHGQERVVSVRRRPRRKVIGTLVVIVLLVPAALLAVRSLWGTMTGTIADPETGITAHRAAEPSLDPDDPFSATPAESFAEAPDALRLPTATKLGTWGAKDVQTALNGTKAIVLKARTDATVLGGDPAGYVKTLSVSAQPAAKRSIASDALGYVTQLAPGYTLAEPVRAAGTLSVKAGSVNQLIITADAVWVYPLAGPLPKASAGAGVRLVVLHTVETYEWFPSKRFTDDDQGARPGEGTRAVFNVDCQKYAKGMLGLPTKAMHDPAAGAEAVFALNTKPDAFPTGC